jgi:DNA-binding GntR family transcriptional regulator
VQRAHGQHREIFEFIENGNYAQGEEMLSRHILDAKNDMINCIKDRFEILSISSI